MSQVNNQEGSSFTESLITIVIAGVACVAFISVVASLVRETKNREVKDMMTSYAFDGLGEVRRLSSLGLPVELEELKTYTYSIEGDELTLLSDVGEVDCTGEASECEKLSLSENAQGEGDEFFYRKVMISSEGTLANGVASVTVEVGRVNPIGTDNLDSYSLNGFISTK